MGQWSSLRKLTLPSSSSSYFFFLFSLFSSRLVFAPHRVWQYFNGSVNLADRRLRNEFSFFLLLLRGVTIEARFEKSFAKLISSSYDFQQISNADLCPPLFFKNKTKRSKSYVFFKSHASLQKWVGPYPMQRMNLWNKESRPRISRGDKNNYKTWLFRAHYNSAGFKRKLSFVSPNSYCMHRNHK